MKVEIERVGGGPKTLESFADEHNLTMKVTEMSKGAGAKYSARFDGVEIMERGYLVSTAGYGETPDKAIADFAEQIVGKRLAYHAYREDRREFQAPNEWNAS